MNNIGSGFFLFFSTVFANTHQFHFVALHSKAILFAYLDLILFDKSVLELDGFFALSTNEMIVMLDVEPPFVTFLAVIKGVRFNYFAINQKF